MYNGINQNTFGYAEMYEWISVPEKRYGRFVQFCDKEDEYQCIELATDIDKVFGVSTANAFQVADNPDEWFLKYTFNEYGDILCKNEIIAVSDKKFDDVLELSYITTQKQEIYVPLVNNLYDPQKEYIKRDSRAEWISVNLIGKCIVEDNGTCEAGKYCTLYNGDDKEKFGTAIPTDKNATKKWYVLNRVSNNTILILYK